MLRKVAGLSIFAIALSLAASSMAQTVDGFTIGEDFELGAHSHPEPSASSPVGTFLGARWTLMDGNSVSVTYDPKTRKIVYIEKDFGDGTASPELGLPHFTLGSTTLNDVRRTLGSNGFGFTHHVISVIGPNLISMNCYGLASPANVTLALGTALPIRTVPIIDGKPVPDPGRGTLVAIIFADDSYLQQIWGSERLADPAYRPVTLK